MITKYLDAELPAKYANLNAAPELTATKHHNGKMYSLLGKQEKLYSLGHRCKLGMRAFAKTLFSLGLLLLLAQTKQDWKGFWEGKKVVALYQSRGAEVEQAIKKTSPIEDNFTKNKTIEEQRQAHEEAKQFLKENLAKVGATVDFISPPPTAVPAVKDVKITQKLDATVFTFHYTRGVKEDIQKDGVRADDKLVVYGVASQFNGCEAPTKQTVAPNEAYITYIHDHTQGPQAQLAFPRAQVELINCGGNRGFNGLCKVLDQNTQDAIEHGYFTPSEKNAKAIIQQLQTQGHKIEYSCVANIPLKGQRPVYQILVSAPAFGDYDYEDFVLRTQAEDRQEIEFLCALHAYRAQFEHCIHLAQDKKQPVEFKPTVPGLGVFENSPTSIAKAFYQAAQEYQQALKDNQVTVALQVFKNNQGKVNAKVLAVIQELDLDNSDNLK